MGSELIQQISDPISVSALWDQYIESRRRLDHPDRMTFDWFSLALAYLYSLGLVELTLEGYLRQSRVY